MRSIAFRPFSVTIWRLSLWPVEYRFDFDPDDVLVSEEQREDETVITALFKPTGPLTRHVAPWHIRLGWWCVGWPIWKVWGLVERFRKTEGDHRKAKESNVGGCHRRYRVVIAQRAGAMSRQTSTVGGGREDSGEEMDARALATNVLTVGRERSGFHEDV